MKKRVVLFLGLTFFFTYGALAVMALARIPYGSPLCTSIFAVCMLFPALGSLITRLLTKEGWRDSFLRLHWKGNWRFYLFGLFGPPLLTVVGAIVYFLLFPKQFDPGFAIIAQMLEAQGLDGSIAPWIVLSQLVLGLFGGILNFPFALGEELGWRGYLFPKLCQRMSARWAAILTGVIWGLWHAPMIAMGHNYGVGYLTAPWGGILAMVVFCIVCGASLCYLTARTQSVFPAALWHGALNAFSAAPVLFLATGVYNPFLGPVPTGIIGGVGMIAAAIFCLWRMQGQKDHSPLPSAKKQAGML